MDAPSVLLVEDEATLRDIIGRNLAVRGYRVTAVDTAQAAVESALTAPPAVLVLDINLPDRSGWDVLRELRATGCGCIPTVVLTAVRCSPSRLDEFRPEAYLPKPFPLASLMGAVQRLAHGEAPPAGTHETMDAGHGAA